MPLFSVVIPTYNRAGLLAAALDSLTNQTFTDFEAVVADDGSTDDTEQVAARYPFVRYIRQQNAGPGAARNLGLKHASGEYVAFLDSDDLWFPWTLAVYADVIDLAGQPAVVIGNALQFEDAASVGGASVAEVSMTSHRDFLATADRTCWYGTPALVARRNELIAAGGFPDVRVNAEDLDLLLKLGAAPGCVVIDAPHTFAYRRHPDSAMANLPRTVRGLNRLIDEERAGRYPGGSARRRERLELITRFTRPFVLAAGGRKAGWQVFSRTAGWNLAVGRFRFVAAVPTLAAAGAVRDLGAGGVRPAEDGRGRGRPGMTPIASVVFTTKNRKDELRTALASAFTQSVPVEVVVIDDGSTDGTADLVRAEFPAVRLMAHTESHGLIVRRNELAELARGPVVFSMDDDAAFSTPHVIAQTLAEFDHPRVGAVAVPFINVNQDSVVRQRAPDADRVYALADYIGTAHAVRRELFLALGGYRGHLVHQGEEGDFCVRMLATGYVVRAGRADPIHHYESARRSFARMDYYGRRNDILFEWHNCPAWRLPGRLLAATAGGLAFGLKVGRPFRMVYGLLGGYAQAGRRFAHRRPVPGRVYDLYRWLRKHGPVPVGELQTRLPPTAVRESVETAL